MTRTHALTLDEFLRREETKPYSEYACGRVFQKPMPNRDHSAIQLYLGAMLLHFLQRTQFGRAFPEFRCIFGPPGRERAYVPDLVFVSRGRLTDDVFLRSAPDLAVEILSPDQHMTLFLDKIQFYLLYGVRTVWVIDPATATITVERPGEEAVVLGSGEILDGGDLLPGFSVLVDDIFAQMAI